MNRTGRKLTRAMKRLMSSKEMNVGDVVLRWRERPAGNYDPVLDAGNPAFTPQETTDTKRAFIHYVTVGSTGFIRHSEVAQGDIILDFLGDVDLDGRDDLQFEIVEADGSKTVCIQKSGGEALAKSWDVRCGGTPITRSVLVTPKA